MSRGEGYAGACVADGYCGLVKVSRWPKDLGVLLYKALLSGGGFMSRVNTRTLGIRRAWVAAAS